MYIRLPRELEIAARYELSCLGLATSLNENLGTSRTIKSGEMLVRSGLKAKSFMLLSDDIDRLSYQAPRVNHCSFHFLSHHLGIYSTSWH